MAEMSLTSQVDGKQGRGVHVVLAARSDDECRRWMVQLDAGLCVCSPSPPMLYFRPLPPFFAASALSFASFTCMILQQRGVCLQ